MRRYKAQRKKSPDHPPAPPCKGGLPCLVVGSDRLGTLFKIGVLPWGPGLGGGATRAGGLHVRGGLALRPFSTRVRPRGAFARGGLVFLLVFFLFSFFLSANFERNNGRVVYTPPVQPATKRSPPSPPEQ